MPDAHPHRALALAALLVACSSGPTPLAGTVVTCGDGVSAIQARAARLGIDGIQADAATGQVALTDSMEDAGDEGWRGILEPVLTSKGSFVARHGVSGVPLFVGSPESSGWTRGSLGARLTLELQASGIETRGAPTLDWEVDGESIGSCRPTEAGACVLHGEVTRVATLYAVSAAALPCPASFSDG